jgi:regulation of enolase protein 1 (concanavalin A-like superfamily)
MSEHFAKPCLTDNWVRDFFMNVSSINPPHKTFAKCFCLVSMLLPVAGTAWADLPQGWSDADIGSPGLAGSATYAGGLWTVAGGGSDIWNTADQFNFASTNYTGDGTMIVRVTSLQNSDPSSGWSKAGLMFRNDSTAASANASIVATAGQGVSFQWRSTAGGSSSFSAHSGITAPVWLKLVRSSANFTGYYSTDGSNWVQVSSQSVTMNNTVMAGLDVTAHNNSALNTATFTNFSLGFVATPPVNVTINATNVINTVPPDAFGIFMAVWDTWGGSTPTQLKQAGVTAMRYPGGSYADSYQWSSYQMTPAFGQAGNLGYLSGATDMGHFIQLMSNAQAQAVISVDWGSGFLWNSNKTAMAIPSTNGSPQEAAAWVAYCNSSTNIYGTTNDVTIGVDAEGNNWQTAGYWAMIRAASPLAQNDGYNFLRINHPAPVGIKYWEVGNEPYGNGYYGGGDSWECDYAVPYPYTNHTREANALLSPAAYGQAVKAFSIAMKAVDPAIEVGAYSSTPPGDYSWDYISGVNNGQHWTPQVLAQCGSNIDFVIVHWYPNFSDNVGTSLLSEVGSIIPVMINGTGPYPHTGTNSGLEDWITNYCPNPANVQILVTEFGADNYPYLVDGTNGMPILGPVEALFAADCYSTWLNYPAFANADWLDFDGDSFLGSGNGPVVYAMQMLRHLCNPGDAVVKATSDTGNLRAQGVMRQDGNLGILLINESINSSQTANVTVSNANLNTTGTIYQFGANNWTSINEVPATGPGSNSISGVGSTFSVTLPAYTMDVLVIPVLGNTPPVLAAISNYTVNVGQTVAFTASATDTDQPPQTLTFALLAGAANATLDTNSGAFSFRPLVTQANSTNNFALKVSDNGSPSMSDTQSFYVAVNPLSAPGVSNISFAFGQFSFNVNGQSGPDYAIETSTNLTQWSNIFITNSPMLPFNWTDTNSAAPQQFYRVKLGPPLP